MPRSYRFIVSGKVQGVGFRHAVMRKACVLGLSGWVRNRSDGQVDGQVASDDLTSLEEFHRFLAQGPASAVVSKVSWLPSALAGGAGFRILESQAPDGDVGPR